MEIIEVNLSKRSVAGYLGLVKDYSSRPLVQSSFLSMSLTAVRLAELRLGYILARTSSSKPSK